MRNGIDERAVFRLSFPFAMAKQFETLRASELYCPRCKVLRPVRERLLLVLPRVEIYEYRCVTCSESLGSREVKESGDGIVTAVGGGC